MVEPAAIAVQVRYHNMLRHRTGVAQETVTLPAGSVLCAALEHVAARRGPRLREMLFAPQGSISTHLVVLHNQQLVRPDAAQPTLADGDELLLFPAISGG